MSQGLFYNPNEHDQDFPFVSQIEGMTVNESRPILQFLANHVAKQSNVFQMNWQPGSLVIWDNRCVLHNALNNYQGHRREMWRLALQSC